MRCSSCDQENPELSRFCNRCGAALVPRCASCGHDNVVGARFCNQCGSALAPANVPPASTPKAGSGQPLLRVPAVLAEKILATRGRIEGERRQVTVLFCDIAGSTHIAEQIGAEAYRELLDEYLEESLPCVHRYEGLVNQLAGDGFMAIFGAPIAHDNDAERAAHAALEIQANMQLLAERWQNRLRAPLRARIGLHTGPVIVGTVGTDLHMEYSAVGDTTNVAARIEQNTAPGEISISSATRKLIAQEFVTEETGSAEFKGKSSAVEVYRLLRAVGRSERRHQALRSGLSRFLGRHAELALVLERFDEVRAGAGQVVFIGGEAGIGKSRLVHELRRRIGEDNVLWLEGQCVSFGRQTAYLPIADMLRGLFGIDEADSAEVVVDKVHAFCAEAEPEVANSEPFFRDLLAVDPGDASLAHMEVTLKTGFYFESIRDLVHALARRKPVLLLVEDLHWLDGSSEQLLRRFFDTLTGARVLVLATHRPDYRWPHAERDCYTQLSLRGLPSKLVNELTDGVLGRMAVPERLREAIAKRSDGNPFFVEEIAKAIAEQGVIDPDAASRLEVPATVQEVIQARIDRLDDRARRTLQIASVIGREFTLRLLERAAELEHGAPELLSVLRDLELIYEKHMQPELAYMFKHALTHDVAYDTLLERERRQMHARVARLIEELYADRVAEFYEVLAFQHLGAGNAARAAHYERLAGERAARHLGPEALTHLQRAIELAQQDESARDTLLAARSSLARVLLRYGRITEANAELGAAIEIAADEPTRRELRNRIEHQRVIDYDGAPVRYYVCGMDHDASERTPIVFFHPLIQASIAFQDAAQRLSRKRPVVFIDAPAATGAPGEETFDFEKRLGAMIAALDDLPYRRFILLGDSDGVRFALSVHERMPERIERMILFGYALGARSADNPLGQSEEELAAWDTFLQADYDTILRGFFRLMFDEPGASIWQEVVTNDWRALWPERLMKTFLRDAVRSDVSALAKRVRVPTLVMAAERDPTTPAHMRQYLDWIPGAAFAEIKGASHSAPFTQCETFCTIVETFLETGTLPKEEWSAADA